MASAIYPKAKEAFLGGSINLSSDTIKVALVSTTDSSYNSANQYKSSVTSYGASTDQTLGTKAVTNGIFDAADSTFTAVAVSGTKQVNALVIYKDTGSAATSPLIAWIDGFTAITPNTGDITVAWDNGASKIFAL
jgi:hypothetical protein